jgi:hypothetical protein
MDNEAKDMEFINTERRIQMYFNLYFFDYY